jgi:hypothetical protein
MGSFYDILLYCPVKLRLVGQETFISLLLAFYEHVFQFQLISCSFMRSKGLQLKTAQYPLRIQKLVITGMFEYEYF